MTSGISYTRGDVGTRSGSGSGSGSGRFRDLLRTDARILELWISRRDYADILRDLSQDATLELKPYISMGGGGSGSGGGGLSSGSIGGVGLIGEVEASSETFLLCCGGLTPEEEDDVAPGYLVVVREGTGGSGNWTKETVKKAPRFFDDPVGSGSGPGGVQIHSPVPSFGGPGMTLTTRGRVSSSSSSVPPVPVPSVPVPDDGMGLGSGSGFLGYPVSSKVELREDWVKRAIENWGMTLLPVPAPGDVSFSGSGSSARGGIDGFRTKEESKMSVAHTRRGRVRPAGGGSVSSLGPASNRDPLPTHLVGYYLPSSPLGVHRYLALLQSLTMGLQCALKKSSSSTSPLFLPRIPVDPGGFKG